jgi:hypothetical protein
MLAARARRRHTGVMAVLPSPATDQRIDVLAALIALPIPTPCRDGVHANLVLLDRYAALVMDFSLPPECEPAPEYRP